MKGLMLLAAAATLAACHNRSDEQTGAAPDRGDSTAVTYDTTAMNRDTTAVTGDTSAVTHQVDPERTGPPGTAGRPGNATITPDSVGTDSTGVQVDSTARTSPSPVSVPQDTLGPNNIDSTAVDSSHTDTTTAR
jgi:hypothetical protein